MTCPSQPGASDVLTFTAVGNDWNSGTAAKYELRRSDQPITQDNFSLATPVDVTQAPKPDGSAETLTVPHVAGEAFYAIRAVDPAGNIGPVQVLSGPAGFNPFGGNGAVKGATETLPNSAAGADPRATWLLLALAVIVMVVLTGLARRLARP